MSMRRVSIAAFFALGKAASCDKCGADASYSEVIANDVRTVTTNGCPNHYSICTGKPGISVCGGVGAEGTDTETKTSDKTFAIPATPMLAASSEDVSCDLGYLGLAFNGVSFYSGAVDTKCTQLDPADATGEWSGFDYCSGHSQRTGDYHYHFPPSCLIAQSTDLTGGHSAQLGWNRDGFPIYGPKGKDGIAVKNCGAAGADAQVCQDACGGIAGALPGIDDFLYRYYFTGPTSDLASLPSDPKPNTADYSPFTIACNKGCTVENWSTCSGTATAGTTANYTAATATGMTTKYQADNDLTCGSGSNSSTSSSGAAVLAVAMTSLCALLF